MSILVEDPAEVLPLMSRLEHLVKSATEEAADPEVRGVAVKAYKKQEAAGVGAQRTGCWRTRMRWPSSYWSAHPWPPEQGVWSVQGSVSLAHGNLKLLQLRDAPQRSRVYSLSGSNQCGLPTLMRAIANERLWSVIVEHENEEEEVLACRTATSRL